MSILPYLSSFLFKSSEIFINQLKISTSFRVPWCAGVTFLSIGPGIATTKGATASTNQQQTGNKLNQRRHSQWLFQLIPAVCGFFLPFQRSFGSLFADQDGLSTGREA
jgi:hypothetical protein